MKTEETLKPELIAPCGINCGICLAYLRKKNKCGGCNGPDDQKPNYCRTCVMKNCELLAKTDSGLCIDCEKFPCQRLKRLDKRYSTGYNVTNIGNLRHIKEKGMSDFLETQRERYRCAKCGGVICVHRNFCLECGKE